MSDSPVESPSLPDPAQRLPRGPFQFDLRHRCHATSARVGAVRTPNGSFETPAFMPVGTAASVKGVDPLDLVATGSQILLGNTYHLNLRPTAEVIADLGGLHRFMGWEGPILTDSGGYQVFSLGDLTDLDAEGVTFKSHLDGRTVRLTPERAMEIQTLLGADILMVFDECLPAGASRESVASSLKERTIPWILRSLDCHPGQGRAVFAIGQGGLYEDQRQRCLERLLPHPFDGFAIGGLSVGESTEDLRRLCAVSCAMLPEDKPRYLMGVGSVPELLDCVALGIDMFDCVLPTRNARNAWAMTFRGPLRLKNAAFTRDDQPLEADCPCSTCARGFSRAYLRHLLLSRELLGATLMSIHNLTFMQRLTEGMREAVRKGTFEEYRRSVLSRWT